MIFINFINYFKCTSCIFIAFTVVTAIYMAILFIHPWVSKDTQVTALSSVGVLMMRPWYFTFSVLIYILYMCLPQSSRITSHTFSISFSPSSLTDIVLFLARWNVTVSKTSCLSHLLNEDPFIFYTAHYPDMLPITEAIWWKLLFASSTNVS